MRYLSIYVGGTAVLPNMPFCLFSVSSRLLLLVFILISLVFYISRIFPFPLQIKAGKAVVGSFLLPGQDGLSGAVPVLRPAFIMTVFVRKYRCQMRPKHFVLTSTTYVCIIRV